LIAVYDSDDSSESNEKSKSIASYEREVRELEGAVHLDSSWVFQIVNGVDQPTSAVKADPRLIMLEHHYCVSKTTWINGYFSKNANYTNTVKKNQLHTFLSKHEITSNGMERSDLDSHHHHQARCRYHNFDVHQTGTKVEPRGMKKNGFNCECPFEAPYVGTTNSMIFAWNSMVKDSTNCNKVGHQKNPKRIHNASEPYLIGEQQRYTFSSLVDFLSKNSALLDPTSTLSMLAFSMTYDDSIVNNFFNGNGCGKKERVYYFIMDQPRWKILSSMKSAKNTLIPLMDKHNYCEKLLQEYASENGEQLCWQKAFQSGDVSDLLVAFMKNRCRNVEKTRFDDWFSVAPIGANRCVLAIRKDIFLCMKSNWICHYYSNIPIYDQLLKHWNLKSCYGLVDRTRKFNVLRKLLIWLEKNANKNVHFMLSPDHADFEEVYNVLFAILDMWNTNLDDFKRELIYSYANPTRPSILKSIVSLLLIKKKHVVDKGVITKLHDWLAGLIDVTGSKSEDHDRNLVKKKFPYLSHVLHVLKMCNTVSDRERSLKNIVEGISNNSLPGVSADMKVKLFKTKEPYSVISRASGSKNTTRGAKSEELNSSDDLLDISFYGMGGVNNLKRFRGGEFKYRESVEKNLVDFSFLKDFKNDDDVKELIDMLEMQRKGEVGDVFESMNLGSELNEKYLRIQNFNKKIETFRKNAQLIHALDSYSHIMENSGCLFEYKYRKKKLRESEIPGESLRKVKGIMKKSKMRKGLVGTSKKMDKSGPYLQQLPAKTMKMICTILKEVNLVGDRESNKRAKLNHADSSSRALGLDTPSIMSNVDKESSAGAEGIGDGENLERRDVNSFLDFEEVKLKKENEECEEWLVLGEYYAIKMLYQACSCNEIPTELRKQLFLNILLVHKIKSSKKRSVAKKTEYGLVASPSLDSENPVCANMLDTEITDGSILWNMGTIIKDKNVMKNILVPIDFNPPRLRTKGVEYMKHLERVKEKNKEELKDYLKTLSGNKDLGNFDESGTFRSVKKGKRSKGTKSKNTKEIDEWLWMDDVLFGDDGKKLDLIDKLTRGNDAVNNYGYTQMLLFAYVEYLYKVGTAKENLDNVFKNMDLAIMSYVPYFQPFKKSLATQKIISLDRDEKIKKRTEISNDDQIRSNVELDQSFIDSCGSNETTDPSKESVVKLSTYLNQMYSKIGQNNENKRKLNWYNTSMVNSTYDDSFFVIFYNNLELKRWKMLSDIYIRKEGSGDVFINNPPSDLDLSESNIILDPQFLSMEAFMVENVLANLENPSMYDNNEKRECETFIKQIKEKISKNAMLKHLQPKNVESDSKKNLKLPNLNDCCDKSEEGCDEAAAALESDLLRLDPVMRDKLKEMMANLESMGVDYQLYPFDEDNKDMDDEYDQTKEIFFITRYRQ